MVIRWDDDPFCGVLSEPQFITVCSSTKKDPDESVISQRKKLSDPAQTPLSKELRKEIRQLKERLGGHHDDVILALVEAGKACRKSGHDEEALEFYKEALQLQRYLLGYEHQDVADTLCLLAASMKAKVCLNKSIEYYDAALGIYELATREFDTTTVEERLELKCKIVNALNSIGNIKFEQRKFDEAKGKYHRAMKFLRYAIPEAEEAAGNESIEVSTDGGHILTCSTSEGEKINSFLRQAQLQKADTLNNIASVHGERSEWAEAIQFYNKALNLQMELLGEDDPIVANTLNNIGTMNFRYGNLLVALKSYKQVAKMRKNTLGNCIQVSDALVNVALVHEKSGNIDQAEKMYSSALRIAIADVGENHIKVAKIMMALGEIYYARNGKDDLALQFFIDSWTIFKSAGLDDEHFLVKAATKSIADIRYRNQDDLGTTMSVFYDVIKLLGCEGLAAFSVDSDLEVNSFMGTLSKANLQVTQAAF